MSDAHHTIEVEPDARGLRIAVVVSRYNRNVTDRLLDGAATEFRRLGGRPEDLLVIPAPGAFELVVLARAALERVDAVVALGCLIRGETRHDRVIGDSVAAELARLGVDTGKAVGFGLLTVETPEQAAARSQPLGREASSLAPGSAKAPVDNKGVEAMAAAVLTARTLEKIRNRT